MEVLKEFLASPDNPREWMHEIHLYDGFLYATDAHTMCRRKENGEHLINNFFQNNKLSEWFSEDKFIGELSIKAFIDSLDAHKTESVFANKLIDCNECDGLGSVTCDLEHEHECNNCDKGKLAVPDESNEIGKKIPDTTYIEFPTSSDKRYCFKIPMFSKLSFLGDSVKVYFNDKKDNSLFFKSGEYEVIIMRCHIENETTEYNMLSTEKFITK